MKQDDPRQIERELADLRQKLSFITTGVGVPAFTPDGRAIYLRQDGGTDTTLYVWEGTAWLPK